MMCNTTPILSHVWLADGSKLAVTTTEDVSLEDVPYTQERFTSHTYSFTVSSPRRKDWNKIWGWRNWDKPRKRQWIKAEQMQYRTIKKSPLNRMEESDDYE